MHIAIFHIAENVKTAEIQVAVYKLGSLNITSYYMIIERTKWRKTISFEISLFDTNLFDSLGKFAQLHTVTEHTDVAALTISVHSYTLNGHTKNRGQNEIIKIYKNKVH